MEANIRLEESVSFPISYWRENSGIAYRSQSKCDQIRPDPGSIKRHSLNQFTVMNSSLTKI